MKVYCCTQEFTLRHSDFDFKDELKLSAYLALAQEIAGTSADELGFGYADLKPKDMGFIIVNTYCEILRPVRLGEQVKVESWPLPPRHGIFERAYRVSVSGEVRANLSSRWCLVDLKTFSLLGAEALGAAHENCPYRQEKTVEVPAWKIPKLDGGKEIYALRVGNSQCDHYLHANNTRYADFFCDCFSMEELSRPVKSFQIAYVKQAKEGQELSLYRGDFESESICEARASGELLSQFRIQFA